eukprot:EG_transcript_16818
MDEPHFRPYEGTDRRCTGVASWLCSAAFSPDVALAVVGSSSGWVRLLAVATAQELSSFRAENSAVSAVAYGATGEFIAAGTASGLVHLRHAATGREVGYFQGHASSVCAVDIASDGRRIASGDSDGLVFQWDTTSGEDVCFEVPLESLSFDSALDCFSADATCSLSYSPDGERLASGGAHGVVALWDAVAGAAITQFNNEDWVNAVVFVPTADLLASGGSNGHVRLWDCKSGKQSGCLVVPEAGAAAEAVAFSPAGPLAAVGDSNGCIHTWDVRRVAGPSKHAAHLDSVCAMGFAPDGGRLASISTAHGGRGDTVRVITVAEVPPATTAPTHSPETQGAPWPAAPSASSS